MPETPYLQLEKHFKRLLLLRDAEAMLQWDWATMMPAESADARGEQLAEIKAVQHGIISAAIVEELLQAAQDDTTLDDWQSANLRRMQHIWLHETALSEDMVVALSKASSACETMWRTARPENDFAAIAPGLETLLGLVREEAAAKGEKLNLGPYDALLDKYEPAARSKDIDVMFFDLKEFLPGFLAEVMEHQAQKSKAVLPEGPFTIESQQALSVNLMRQLGFDFNRGRLDISLHPFCGGTHGDVRITTRYDENDFTSAIMGVLHETGHALYEMGLPEKWRTQPVGDALGMATHESQSLLMEMQVCRGRDFLSFVAPLMQEAFGGSEAVWQVDNLLNLYSRVEPGFIRVDADEVTYSLHVILRYDLEKAMINGELRVGDLPEAWNEGMKNLLGITPASDSQGCLQDIHWFGGDWGYFPTYSLGAMAAAQLYEAARQATPAIDEAIRRGDFKPLRHWLHTNIHGKGCLLSSRDLMVQASGRPLDCASFKRHLQARYPGYSP